MSVSKLMEFFSSFSVLPVEIEQVREQIVEVYKPVDDIVFHQFSQSSKQLRGIHYRYGERLVDGKLKKTVLIGYASDTSIDWQRITCCKELVHITDVRQVQTRTKRQVEGLIARLVSTSRDVKLGTSDLAVIKDQIATYQAASILFPEEMREEIAKKFREGKISIEEICELVVIPREHVELLMSDEWPNILAVLKEF